VTQGGNTGLVGGSVPADPAVLLSTTRLAQVAGVEPVGGQLTAGAGATLADVHAAAKAVGRRFAVDLGARDRATVGGMIATNAGGTHAARLGSMRRHVVGVEAVMADGSVVSHLGGLLKDNTGYDLAGLLCGSEGTLAVVCAARLRLIPVPRETATAWVTFGSVPEAVHAGLTWFADDPVVEVVELLDERCMRLSNAPAGGAALLVEASGDGATERLGALVGDADADVAVTPAQRSALWERRDGIPERIRRQGVPVKADVAVPPAAVPELVARIPEAVTPVAAGAEWFCFGHLADGNIHVNLLAPGEDATAVEAAVLRLAVSLGGTISAEHGIGRDKVDLLPLVRTPAELVAFRSIKAALDPRGRLNPGVLLPAD
jgi:FAD/FMN-containing dehydrogenase